MKKLFLLDGHALAYRAHYAFIARPLINANGVNVSCVTGFTRTVLEVLKKEKPSHLAVAFDLSGPTFRHERYPEYKANRDAQPEDITIGLKSVIEILEGMKIPILTKEGFEADDVIGTLAQQAEKEGFTVYMMTPDKDYAQLVTDNIFLYKPARSGNEVEVLGVQEILTNWGIKRVEQVTDVLGLQGDAVDNIPGIKGIGPKTATLLLEKYDSVENIVAHAHELKGKQREMVETHGQMGLLSKELATIDTKVPIQFDAKSCEVSEDIDKPRLSAIFKALALRSVAKEVLGKYEEPVEEVVTQVVENQQLDLFGNPIVSKQNLNPAPAKVEKSGEEEAYSVADKNISNTPHQYYLVDNQKDIDALIVKLSQSKVFAFDTETTHIEPVRAELVGMSFSIHTAEAYYVPVPADRQAAQQFVDLFKNIFENPAIQKIGQNIKYEIIVLNNYNIELQGIYFDTMLAHYLIEPELRHNLDYMSETYLKYAPIRIETLIGKGKNQLSMRDVAVEKVSDYAAEDADMTFQLYSFFKPTIQSDKVLYHLFRTMEMPLVSVLAEVESEGIRLDAPFLENYAKILAVDIVAAEKKIYEIAGFQFNIGSPKQVGEALFDKLKLPYRWKKTSKNDQYSTDEEKLAELALNYPIVSAILDYRSLSKLQSTYVEALPKLIHPRTGRVHSSFNQALTATGRLSSNQPNLQNIPIRTEQGRKIRQAFIARDPNHVLLSADYSQIELRLIAHAADEQAMLEAFNAGHDIHQATAAKVYGIPLNEVTPTQRRNAKTVNFAILYGAGSTNLSKQLDISRTEAKTLIDNYFAQYVGLKTYMDKVVEQARTDGFVTTLMGRRRYLRDINSRNDLARTNAERMAINTPIQGSAADMIKIAMIHIHKYLKEHHLNTKMILQVHDELVFDVPETEVEIVKPMVERLMKTAIPNLKVPILVGMGIGANWLEAH
jgi:DNA polymerase I